MSKNKKAKLLFNKFKIISELPGQEAAKAFDGVDIETNIQVYIKKKELKSSLKREAYRQIHLQGKGIPKLYLYGYTSDDQYLSRNGEVSNVYDIIISEHLGKNLQYLFNKNNKKFLLGTICEIAIQGIKLIEYMHNKHFIHRNIKPDVFYQGVDAKSGRLYLTNFYYAKQYYTEENGHIQNSKGKKLIVDPNYCSVAALMGNELSRKDDLESFGYVLCYFFSETLPWFNLKGSSNEEIKNKLFKMKQTFIFEDVKNGYPIEFYKYFNIINLLEFDEKPDYNKLISLFEKIAKKRNAKIELNFVMPKSAEKVNKKRIRSKTITDSSIIKEAMKNEDTGRNEFKKTKSVILKENPLEEKILLEVTNNNINTNNTIKREKSLENTRRQSVYFTNKISSSKFNVFQNNSKNIANNSPPNKKRKLAKSSSQKNIDNNIVIQKLMFGNNNNNLDDNNNYNTKPEFSAFEIIKKNNNSLKNNINSNRKHISEDKDSDAKIKSSPKETQSSKNQVYAFENADILSFGGDNLN